MASANKNQTIATPSVFQGEVATAQDVGPNGAYMTQEQGSALVAAGLATVDPANLQGNAALVTLTPAGIASLSAPVTASVVIPIFTIRSDIPMPTVKRRGRKGGSKYPIESMEVKQSFHIAITATDPDPASRIASSLANARLKFAIPVSNDDGSPKMVEKTIRVYQKNADGKGLAKGADGHRIVESETKETVQETTNGRDWAVATVDASDPEGAGARIWRTK